MILLPSSPTYGEEMSRLNGNGWSRTHSQQAASHSFPARAVPARVAWRSSWPPESPVVEVKATPGSTAPPK